MHHLGADISGRGQMYQEKQETAEYRVVYSPQVAVRDKPWGKVISAKKSGESIKRRKSMDSTQLIGMIELMHLRK